MNNLNSVLIEGNLVKDPELQTFDQDKMKAVLVIANNRYYTDKEGEFIQEVSYFTVTAWGLLAKSCTNYLKKGRGVRVVGRIRQDRWKEKNDEYRERIGIVAEHIEFMPEKKKTVEEINDKAIEDQYEKSLKKIKKEDKQKVKRA